MLGFAYFPAFAAYVLQYAQVHNAAYESKTSSFEQTISVVVKCNLFEEKGMSYLPCCIFARRSFRLPAFSFFQLIFDVRLRPAISAKNYIYTLVANKLAKASKICWTIANKTVVLALGIRCLHVTKPTSWPPCVQNLLRLLPKVMTEVCPY